LLQLMLGSGRWWSRCPPTYRLDPL